MTIGIYVYLKKTRIFIKYVKGLFKKINQRINKRSLQRVTTL